jgi:hypothetical protein
LVISKTPMKAKIINIRVSLDENIKEKISYIIKKCRLLKIDRHMWILKEIKFESTFI